MSDPISTREVLGRIFQTKAVVTKRREVFMVGRTLIHLDEVENLGAFMELEVVLKESEAASDGERIANLLMSQLGIRQEDLIREAYVDLLEAQHS